MKRLHRGFFASMKLRSARLLRPGVVAVLLAGVTAVGVPASTDAGGLPKVAVTLTYNDSCTASFTITASWTAQPGQVLLRTHMNSGGSYTWGPELALDSTTTTATLQVYEMDSATKTHRYSATVYITTGYPPADPPLVTLAQGSSKGRVPVPCAIT